MQVVDVKPRKGYEQGRQELDADLGEEGDKLSFKLIPYNTNGTADVTKAKAVEYTYPTEEPVVVPVTPAVDEEEP